MEYQLIRSRRRTLALQLKPDGWQDYRGTYEEFVEDQKRRGVTEIRL